MGPFFQALDFLSPYFSGTFSSWEASYTPMDKDYYYDAYAFLKNPAGSWIKKKINPDNVKIKDRMMLSGNGRRLFWNRWPAESGINSPLH
jgi:hypothetical protein